MLLDMDGTLTRPMLDFPKIKSDMGIGNRPILEALAGMNASERTKAQAILESHEEQAAENSVLNSGCDELMQWARDNSLPTALITRNSRQSVETVLRRHGLQFDVLLTRDDGLQKPDPAPLFRACETLRVNVLEAWMVGDGHYDIEAGLAAGAQTVWISHGQNRDFDAIPWKTVPDLQTLLNELRAAVSNGRRNG